MGNQNDTGLAEALLDGMADLGIGFCIHSGERIVEDHDGGITQQHTGDSGSLLLTAGKGHTTLADHGIIACSEGCDGLVQRGGLRSFPNGLHIQFRRYDADVFSDGAGEEVRLLQHHADIPAQMFCTDLANVRAADGDPSAAFLQRVQFVKEEHQCGFSAAGAAEDAQGGAGFHGKVNVVEDFRAVFIAEAYMLEADVTVHRGIESIRIILLHGGVHNVGHTVDGNTGLAQFGDHPAQLTDGPDHHGVVGNKGDVLTAVQSAVDAEVSAENDHQHHLNAGEDVGGAPEP